MTRALRRGGSLSNTRRTTKPGVIGSVQDPAAGDTALLYGLLTLMRRAEYLGLLDADVDHRPDEPWSWLPAVVAGMIHRGLPACTRWQHLERTSEWRQLTTDAETESDPAATAHRLNSVLSGAVEQLNDQLEMSPQPAGEWAPVTATLGEDMLAQLIGLSVYWVRKYSSGCRATPQDIAERLHFLALLLADLVGSYNAFGILRWLNRPRTQLGGRSPHSLLGEFNPNGKEAAAVAALAATLVGAGSA